MIIAIDGPAASGKGTLGKNIAAHYGLRHLDTGLLYRAVARAVLDAGGKPDDRDAAVTAAQGLDLRKLDETTLKKTPGIGEAASLAAAFSEVRAVLVAVQRDFAAKPPGAVLDGRDIGTVICPKADVKIFVTAAPEIRARRRAKEFSAVGHAVDEAAVLADILKRDDRDTKRSVSPLKQAPDAHLLDTSNMDISTATRVAIDIVEAYRAGRGRG